MKIWKISLKKIGWPRPNHYNRNRSVSCPASWKRRAELFHIACKVLSIQALHQPLLLVRFFPPQWAFSLKVNWTFNEILYKSYPLYHSKLTMRISLSNIIFSHSYTFTYPHNQNPMRRWEGRENFSPVGPVCANLLFMMLEMWNLVRFSGR